MDRLPYRQDRLQNLKNGVRILSLFSLFLLFCGGIVIQDSSIYANEESAQVLGTSNSIYETEAIPSRGFAPKTVSIKGMDFEKTALVYSDNAKDIVTEVGIILDSDDEILPSPTEYIPDNGVIVLVKVHSELFTNYEAIPFEKKEIEDNTMDKGKVVVDTEGAKGLLERVVRVVYKDEVAYRSEVIETKVITAPITEVVRIGTKINTIASCEYWGKVVNDTTSDERERRWLKSIMYWESGCNSGSNYENYFEGSKNFYGLFQFTVYTFEAFGGTNIWDGYDQIKIAHIMYNHYHTDEDLSRQWPTNKMFLKYYGEKYGPKD